MLADSAYYLIKIYPLKDKEFKNNVKPLNSVFIVMLTELQS